MDGEGAVGGMTAAPASSPHPLAHAVTEIGTAFVTQYYNVLHSNTKYLHRFYTDASSLTFCDVDGQPSTVSGQKNIHALWSSLGLENAQTALESVDAQNSVSEGVVVFVTGALQRKGCLKRRFVQSFYLAVQEKGYYVLNDIFRFLSEATELLPGAQQTAVATAPAPLQHNGYAVPLSIPTTSAEPQMNGVEAHAAAAAPPVASAAAPEEPAPAPAQPQQSVPPPPPAAANLPQQEQQQQQHVLEQQPSPPAEPAPPPPPPPPESPLAEPEAVVESQPEVAAPVVPKEEKPVPQVPLVPLTYAQRLKLGAQRAAAAPAPKPKPTPAAPAPAPAAPAASNGVAESGPYPFVEDEALSQSIFVKDLPAEITAARLAEEFTRFGPLRNGVRGVNLKAQKDKPSFAFIEFEADISARAAIAAQVVIDGQTVKVDEKKPLYMTRGRGRGGDFGRGGGRSAEFGRGGFFPGRGGRGAGAPEFAGRGRSGPLRGGYMGRVAPGAERGGRSVPSRGKGLTRDPAIRTGRPGLAEGAATGPVGAAPAAVEA